MDSGGGTLVHGILLAGSYPWRNAPLERLLPRPLLPVAHEPLISYALRWLSDAGVRSVTVCLNAATRRVARDLPAHAPGWPALDYHEDRVPRGPGGCLRDAALLTGAETFVVADACSIPTVSLTDLFAAHRAAGASGTVAVHAADPASRLGSCPAGVYVFERSALEQEAPSGYQDIKEHLIPRLYAAGARVAAHVVHGPGPRVLDLPTYVAANQWVARRLAAGDGRLDGYRVLGETLVHATATVDEDARLLGPVLVGPDSRVRAGATVVGPTVLGRACTIEADAVVARSVAWNRCTVEADALVDASVLADEARVPRGHHLTSEVAAPPARRDVPSDTFGLWVRDLALALRWRSPVRDGLAAPEPLDP
jgi:NDP-sugar pyrophosphorylase family protein